jgi:hypothetical protein
MSAALLKPPSWAVPKVRRSGVGWEVTYVTLPEHYHPRRIFYAQVGPGGEMYAVGQWADGSEHREIPHGSKQYTLLHAEVMRLIGLLEAGKL